MKAVSRPLGPATLLIRPPRKLLRLEDIRSDVTDRPTEPKYME
jgi:hypothetical protein